MAPDIEKLLAPRTDSMAASAIREILKVVGRPGMISLAGGIPAPDTFPMDILEHLFEEVIARWGESAFQYGLTEGFIPLREASVEYLMRFSVQTEAEKVLVTSGSQGMLDAVGKILIGPGDTVAVEAPTYLGALQAFNPYGPRYVEIATDEEGAIPESLEEILIKENPKFTYLVPTFQNPTGRSIPAERRQRIAEILIQHNALLVEDDPYAALRYSGEALPAIKSMAPDNVLYATTFSKVFAPGLRLGIAVPPNGELGDWMVKAKQGTDLHTSSLSQAMAAVYLEGKHLEKQLPIICNHYAPRLEAMLEALEKFFPEGWTWSRPEGGMFLWVEGPEDVDIMALYEKALNEHVAFVPGRYFFADPERGTHTMRLNFTNAEPAAIQTAIAILGKLASR